MHTVVLCHGRHLATKGWETLVFGEGKKIGTAPLALYLALKYGARLIFGTGSSEKDGLLECVYTQKYLLENLSRVIEFPEFKEFAVYDAYERDALFRAVIERAHLDVESQNTRQEIMGAMSYARSLGATQLICVTSPFHNARCPLNVAELREGDVDFGDVLPMNISARSSTEECRASTTVVMEHPHRGDDPMLGASLAPHQVYPRMFRLGAENRRLILENDDRILRDFGV